MQSNLEHHLSSIGWLRCSFRYHFTICSEYPRPRFFKNHLVSISPWCMFCTYNHQHEPWMKGANQGDTSNEVATEPLPLGRPRISRLLDTQYGVPIPFISTKRRRATDLGWSKRSIALLPPHPPPPPGRVTRGPGSLAGRPSSMSGSTGRPILTASPSVNKPARPFVSQRMRFRVSHASLGTAQRLEGRRRDRVPGAVKCSDVLSGRMSGSCARERV